MDFKHIDTTTQNKHASDRTWLLSFIDLLSLLIAFFVLIYSTKDVSGEKIREIKDSFSKYVSEDGTKRFRYIEILNRTEKIKKADNLNYVEQVINGAIHETGTSGVEVTRSSDRVTVTIEENDIDRTNLQEALMERLAVIARGTLHLSNQIEIRTEGVTAEQALQVNTLLVNTLAELGYERKILSVLPQENTLTESVEKNKNPVKMFFIIRTHESLF